MVAARAIFGVGEFLCGKKVGYYLVLAWTVVPPPSLVLNLPMSLSAFIACAALTLLFLLKGSMLGGHVHSHPTHVHVSGGTTANESQHHRVINGRGSSPGIERARNSQRATSRMPA